MFRNHFDYERERQALAGHHLSTKTAALLGSDCELFALESSRLEKDMDDLNKARIELDRRDQDMRKRVIKLGKYLTTFAEQDCLDLATKFYAAVPREVRDLVYSYLYVPNQDLVGKMQHEMYRMTSNSPKSLRQSLHLPHWQSVDYVGPNFAREFAEYFYENTVLHSNCTSQPESWSNIYVVSTILGCDVFEHGISPADFVRSCDITFSPNRRGQIMRQEFPAARWQIKRLLLLKQRSGTITFRIDFSGFLITHRLRLLLTYMFQFGPVFYQFKKKGFNVRVFSSYNILGSVKKWTDITWILDMDKLDLRDKLLDWDRALRLVKPREVKDMDNGTITLREGLIVKNDADYSVLNQMLLNTKED